VLDNLGNRFFDAILQNLLGIPKIQSEAARVGIISRSGVLADAP
jgi:hypothetical protein